jgi:hypothetical protein
LTEEIDIYLRELDYGTRKPVAKEIGVTQSRLSRIINARPVASFVRFIKGIDKHYPDTAAKLFALAERQIKAARESQAPLAWDHEYEKQRLMREFHEALEVVFCDAPAADVRREFLNDIQHQVDRWRARFDAEDRLAASHLRPVIFEGRAPVTHRAAR